MKLKNFFNPFIYVLFLFTGLFFAGNQAALHYAAAEFGSSDAPLSALVGALCLGSMMMVPVLGEISERIGKRLAAVIASLFFAVGGILAAVSQSFPVSAGALFLFGCGVGSLESVGFALIGDYNGPNTGKHMNLSQAVFSVGAVAGPFLINFLLEHASYRVFYGFTGVFMAALAVVLFCSRSIDDFTVKSGGGAGLTVFKLIKDPVMIQFMLTMMAVMGCETAITYWLASYFTALSAPALGAIGLSLYWFASIPGRVFSSRIKNQGLLLTICFAVCGVGILMLLLMPTPEMKLLGILIAGLSLAPAYPGLSTLGGNLYPTQSGASFSLMVFASGLGGTLAQPIIGAVSQAASLVTVYSAIVVIMAALAVLIFIASRLAAKRPQPINAN